MNLSLFWLLRILKSNLVLFASMDAKKLYELIENKNYSEIIKIYDSFIQANPNNSISYW